MPVKQLKMNASRMEASLGISSRLFIILIISCLFRYCFWLSSFFIRQVENGLVRIIPHRYAHRIPFLTILIILAVVLIDSLQSVLKKSSSSCIICRLNCSSGISCLPIFLQNSSSRLQTSLCLLEWDMLICPACASLSASFTCLSNISKGKAGWILWP